MRRSVFMSGSMVLGGLVAAGCGGGDLCDATLESAAGRWEVSFVEGTSSETAIVVIEEDGTVSADTDDNQDWTCEVVKDELCDLEVRCDEVGGTSRFTFTVRHDG